MAQAKCTCGRVLRKMKTDRVATTVFNRTCGGCRTKWRIVCRPKTLGRFAVQFVDLAEIKTN